MEKITFQDDLLHPQKSEQITEISKALQGFQQKVGKIKKSGYNPHFKKPYATISDILAEIKPVLLENNLVLLQEPVAQCLLKTTLIHTESGQFFSSTYYMNPEKDSPQKFGSVITYQRRYAIGAILCLDIEEDDDAELGSTPVAQSGSGEKLQIRLIKRLKELYSLVQSAPEISSKKGEWDSWIQGLNENSEVHNINDAIQRMEKIKKDNNL